MNPGRSQLGIGILVGFLAAAVAGLAVALVLAVTSDDDTTTTTVQSKQTVTQTTQAGGETTGTTATEPRLYSYPSPRAAARAYARVKLGIPGASGMTVVYSRIDDSYALISFFEGDKPVAVWVRRQGAGGQGWIGLAGNTTASDPPSDAGVPSDIVHPFSD